MEEIIHLNKLDVSHDSYRPNWREFSPENITGPYFRVRDGRSIYLCYSLNDRVNKSLLPSTSNDHDIFKRPIVKFNFKIKTDEVFLPGNRAGILFSVHSPFEAVDPFQNGVFLRPGTSYMIYVTVDETILEKGPYETDCVNYTEFWEKNGRSAPRSETMCRHNCAAELSILCYGCIMPIYLYPRKEKYCEIDAKTFVNRNCPDDTSELDEYCNKTCKKDCRQTTFRITVQDRFKGLYDEDGNYNKDIEDLISVEIFLERYEVTVHKHSTKYMNFELFSSIGGFIGIWLGVSLLDIADIFEGFFRICRFSFKKKRELKKIALATQ